MFCKVSVESANIYGLQIKFKSYLLDRIVEVMFAVSLRSTKEKMEVARIRGRG